MGQGFLVQCKHRAREESPRAGAGAVGAPWMGASERVACVTARDSALRDSPLSYGGGWLLTFYALARSPAMVRPGDDTGGHPRGNGPVKNAPVDWRKWGPALGPHILLEGGKKFGPGRGGSSIGT